MRTTSQTDNLETKALNSINPKPILIGIPKKIARGFGWSGFGIIVLCGICCSLPLLGGGLAVGGAALLAFLNLTWFWVGVMPILIISAILLSRRYWGRPGITTSGSPRRFAQSCAKKGDSCPTDHSCGCGNQADYKPRG